MLLPFEDGETHIAKSSSLKREQMLRKIQIHSSSLETLLHTKAHLSQLTLTKRGANTM